MFIDPLYGVVAPDLGWVPPPRFLLRRFRILRLLAAASLGKIVEVGCGGGALLHELALKSEEAVGLESSNRARRLARSIADAGGGKQLIVAAANRGWVRDRDLVCAFDVLEHIEHDQEAVFEWAGWLRSGGRLCISVPAHKSRWGAGDEWAGHWRRYDRADIDSLMLSAGLSVEYMECYGFPLGNVTEWYGERVYRKWLNESRMNTSKAEATGESGIDRDYYVRRFGWISSVPGRLSMRMANALQHAASGTNWGTGYLLAARKP